MTEEEGGRAELTEKVECGLNPRNSAMLAPWFIGQLADHCEYSDHLVI